jgi:membrane protein required for colicin V production
MALVDILVLVIIGISCLLGLVRGLVKEALSLAFWIGAVVLGVIFSPAVGQWLAGYISLENLALQRAVGFVSIFILVVFAGGLISNAMSRLFSAAGLGASDRALGGLFGVIRGVVIVAILVMMTVQLSFTQQYYDESVSMPYVMAAVDFFQNMVGWETAPLDDSFVPAAASN